MFRGESRDNSVGKNRRPTLQAFHQSHGYIVSLELISNSRYPVGFKGTTSVQRFNHRKQFGGNSSRSWGRISCSGTGMGGGGFLMGDSCK